MVFGVFLTGGRVRGAWRFLAFALVAAVLLFASISCLSLIPGIASLVEQARAGTLTIGGLTVIDGTCFLIVLGMTAVAARCEHVAASTFGLPFRRSAATPFATGAAWGLALAAVTVVSISLTGGASFHASIPSAATTFVYALAWGGACVLVALFEELLYRGYVLATLGATIGFWPAALLLAAVFGGLHLLNSAESVVGALNVVVYALFASLALRRTGNLWFAVGMHAAWNYALIFLFGVPGSGMDADGRLLEVHLNGPTWLTGGEAGPEASVVAFVVLAVAAVVFARRFRRRVN